MSIVMLKKKKHAGDEFIAVRILQGFIFRRRRHHHRRRLLHLLPLLSTVSGCLLLLFAIVMFISPPISNHHSLHHLYSSLNKRVLINGEIESVFRVPMSGESSGRDLWASNQSNFFIGCSNSSHHFLSSEITNTKPNRYLLIATSGGLNQQRTGIVDAVVSAYILNATLVVPKLDQNSFWKDASNFSEIFDVEWFIRYLSKDVKIIKHLPEKAGKVITTRAPRKCNQKCYETRILPIFHKKHVQAVQLTKFDYRLSNQLDVSLQKLRCRVNYHALKFTDPILEMGMKLVERMRSKSTHYVALHLRYEPDMLAFSGCYYGGGDKEIKELGTIRKRWKTLHTKNPDKELRHGKCPLTPEEVGLMLRALGFGKGVHIYVASGEVYGGEKTLAPLKALFPNFYTKETIASKDELAQFSSYSSRMAALDFIVCDESDVFVANNNGNMAKILAGKRRYFGHKTTIRPNARKLYRVFHDRHNLTWEEFTSLVRKFQIGFMGEPNEVKPGRGEFHEHPLSCICENSESSRALGDSTHLQVRADKSSNGGEANDEGFSEDEQDLLETEYGEDGNNGIRDGVFQNRKNSDFLLMKSEQQQPELEEIISD
ncbi:O-fucosyltransferase 16 [Castilleja foliolosa]|uniref:O-fucosyltransferase family protein n=1 Tax=Castilleja foliolosa TaxID=1961234 RepID=A0ABD3C4R9_9LAMI